MGEIISWKTDKSELDLEKVYREKKDVFKAFEDRYPGKQVICDFFGMFKIYALANAVKEVKEPNTYTATDIRTSKPYENVTNRAQGEILTAQGKIKKIFLEGNAESLNPDKILGSLYKDGYVGFGYEFINALKPGGFDCAITASGKIYESKNIPQEEIDFGKLYERFVTSMKGTKFFFDEKNNFEEKNANLMIKGKEILKITIQNYFSKKAEKSYDELTKLGKSKEAIKNKHLEIKKEFDSIVAKFNQYYEDINHKKQEKEEIKNDFVL